MAIPQTDLGHYYRALKLTKEIIEASPELVSPAEYDVFLLAWVTVNESLISKYKEAIDEDTDI